VPPKLKRAFYINNDVIGLSKKLLGKTLLTRVNGVKSGGIIVETEAYSGLIDKASHAWPNKKTPRTEVMFDEGGIAYVYLCYGIHHLFNIVTNKKGYPDAILVRAIEPTIGVNHILQRRNTKKLHPGISSGPGKVSSCLGINLDHNRLSLQGTQIWIEETGISDIEIVETTRIGVDYAEEDALLPWRFYIKDNPFVSRK